MKLIKLYLFLLCTLSYSQNQILKGVIKNEKNETISNATILNKSNKLFCFSDNNGLFQIPTNSNNDTIEIKHLGFETYSFISKKENPIINLKEKKINLSEITITYKNKNIAKISNNGNANSLYGIGINKSYLFALNTKSLNSKRIEKIEIPIKFKKGFDKAGTINFQLFKNFDNNSLVEAISQIYSIEVNLLGYEKNIILDFSKQKILIPNENVFLYVERSIPNKVFENNFSLSSNPFFNIDKNGQEGDLFIKVIYDNEWIKIDKTNYPFIPKLNYELFYDE